VLTRHDVGRRVVVRRIVGVRNNRPILTDLLGRLIEATETHVTVQTRSGTHRVPKTEIVAAKTVPDRRRPTATEALELAAAAGWPAADRADLGDWWLRAADGWTNRANSALPIGDPGMPLGEAIDAVAAWYRERNLPPKITVPLPLLTRLDAELDRRGWTASPPTLVRTAPLATMLAGAPPRPDLTPVDLAAAPTPEWLAVAAARKKSLPGVAVKVLTAVPEVRFAHWYGQSGALLATARGVVADPERRYLGIGLVEVAESARRQGLAKHLMRALAEWATGLGARDAYLQVEARNSAAVALYDSLGFATHHLYLTRSGRP
jgi:N-acetylglutamate synthase